MGGPATAHASAATAGGGALIAPARSSHGPPPVRPPLPPPPPPAPPRIRCKAPTRHRESCGVCRRWPVPVTQLSHGPAVEAAALGKADQDAALAPGRHRGFGFARRVGRDAGVAQEPVERNPLCPAALAGAGDRVVRRRILRGAVI